MSAQETRTQKPHERPLPQGWRWVKLGEVCFEDRQIMEARSPDAQALPYLSLEHIESNTGRILRQQQEPSTDEGVSTTFRFTANHVLYGKLRPYLNKVALPDFEGRCTTEIIPLRPNDHITREFLTLILRRPETVEHAMQGKTGSRMPRADMNQLFGLEIPLPPLAEQQRIAAMLREQMAAVEKARKAAEQRLEALKALPAAFLRQVFPQPGQPLPPGWRWVKLGDYTTKIGSGLTPLGGQATYVSTGVALIRSQNVHMNRFVHEGLAFITTEQDDAMSESRVKSGDVLLNITGASIGRVCVVPDEVTPANVNQHVSIIRCVGSLEPCFLSLFLSTPAFQQHILETQAGATRQALTKSLIESFDIPLPPLPEQQRIAAMLREQMAAVEKARKAAEEELETINALPAALLRQAFAGDL